MFNFVILTLSMFTHSEINLPLLRQRAFNLRWAALPEGVIPLTAADPDFPCAPQISEAIIKYSKDRYFSYAPAEGYAFFKEAVAKFFIEKRNVLTQPSLVFPTDSAAHGIHAVCKAYLQKGDEAIVFNPVDFLFKYSVEAVGGIAISFPVPLHPNEGIDFNLLENLITDRTKLICLCNPLNPTGKLFSAAELMVLGNLAIKHNLLILSDEIWSDIVFEPNQFVSIASLNSQIQAHTITVTGYSKSYGLAGLRVGAVIAPNESHFQQILLAAEQPSTIHGCNVLGQVAVATALNDCQDWLFEFIKHLTQMRSLLVDGLNTFPGFHCELPQACYLAFPAISASGKNASEWHQLFLEKAKVAVVPGLPQWFGDRATGHLRLSFATSKETIEEALFRMQKVVLI